MVAILTKYFGPTNFRGSRVKAYTEAGLSVTLSWDDALNPEQNHREAAKALAAKMNWQGSWFGGGTKTGWAFVCAERAYDNSFSIQTDCKVVQS